MQRKLNLRALVATRSHEVSQIVAGIKGDGASMLWTAEMRAATRGGKCVPKWRPEDERATE
jgi:hypothetical protein